MLPRMLSAGHQKEDVRAEGGLTPQFPEHPDFRMAKGGGTKREI